MANRTTRITCAHHANDQFRSRNRFSCETQFMCCNGFGSALDRFFFSSVVGCSAFGPCNYNLAWLKIAPQNVRSVCAFFFFAPLSLVWSLIWLSFLCNTTAPAQGTRRTTDQNMWHGYKARCSCCNTPLVRAHFHERRIFVQLRSRLPLIQTFDGKKLLLQTYAFFCLRSYCSHSHRPFSCNNKSPRATEQKSTTSVSKLNSVA